MQNTYTKVLGNILLCFIYFVAFKELLLFLLWKCHVNSIELNIGDIFMFYLCTDVFDCFFCIQIMFPLDSFPPIACQLSVTRELMFIEKG